MPSPVDDPAAHDITSLLHAFSIGNQSAQKKLFSVVYEELHSLARSAIRRERPGHILQTTALVHEAYLNLVHSSDVQWEDRSHFFRIAAKAMRRVLIAEARARRAVKRGGKQKVLSLHTVKEPGQAFDSPYVPFDYLEVMDQALDKLSRKPGCERLCIIVELRFFAGLTIIDTAKLLDISTATVNRDWLFAKSWLHEEIVRSAEDAR